MHQHTDATVQIGQSWSAIRRAAQAYLAQPEPHAYDLALGWYADPAWEVRYFAVLVLGGLAAADPRALAALYDRCGDDSAWQVNEALAMAFDDYCAAVGYEVALPEIHRWLVAPRANLRRAVSEGLRPWTAGKRAIFARDPQLAIELLGTLKDDHSRYVQESVGNALRDIARKHADLVVAALQAWVAEDPQSKARRTIARFALKHAVKDDPSLRELFA
ncbi:MAG TPA: DNA alkylation repair protein [Roseiflexaceae bacterium]|nr:DNA alkylation repair protein [Roseiflexaceae bacterium]